MKDLIDYSRETGSGPMGKLISFQPYHPLFCSAFDGKSAFDVLDSFSCKKKILAKNMLFSNSSELQDCNLVNSDFLIVVTSISRLRVLRF